MTVLIRGGTLVSHQRTRRGDLLCAEGKVQAVGEGLQAAEGATVIYAGSTTMIMDFAIPERGAGHYLGRKSFTAEAYADV